MRTDSKIKKKAKESYFQLWHFLKMEKQNTFIIYSDQQNMKKKRFVPERERDIWRIYRLDMMAMAILKYYPLK